MKKLLLLSIFTIVGLSAINAQSCRKFTKQECIPSLTPYIHNGQLNSAVLFPGDIADIQLTFYSGQDYRIIVCNDEGLGDVSFKVLDLERNELYDSKSGEENIFDFKVASTQQLIVEVMVPEGSNTHDIDFQGCVSILVGFKS